MHGFHKKKCLERKCDSCDVKGLKDELKAAISEKEIKWYRFEYVADDIINLATQQRRKCPAKQRRR